MLHGRRVARGLTLVIFAVLTTSHVLADMGPKPRIAVTFVDVPLVPLRERTDRVHEAPYNYEGSCNYENLGLLACENAACERWRQLRDLGPARFCCSPGVTEAAGGRRHLSCGGVQYGFPEWLRLRITMDGRAILSNVFRYQRGWMSAAFEARLVGGRLEVARSSGAEHEVDRALEPRPTASGGRPLAVSGGLGVLPNPRFDADHGVLAILNSAGVVSLDGVEYGSAPTEFRLREGLYHVSVRAPSGDLVESDVAVRGGAREEMLLHMRRPCVNERWTPSGSCGNDPTARSVEPRPAPPRPNYSITSRWSAKGAALDGTVKKSVTEAAARELSRCLDAFHPDPATGDGQVALQLTIDAKGAIEAMQIDASGTTLRDPELHACAIRRLENGARIAQTRTAAAVATIVVARVRPPRR